MSVNLNSVPVSQIANAFPDPYTFFQGGRTQISTASLVANEIGAIDNCFNDGMRVLRKVSPTMAAEIEPQRAIAHLMGSIAKGVLTSTGAPKQITYPSQVGTVGVTWLIPQAIRYTATPSSTNPCYTDYIADTWNISVSAGTPVNILGATTYATNLVPGTSTSALTISNRYQACNQANQHQFWFVFQNGVLEIGSSPSIEQWHIETQTANQYGIYTTSPINEQTIETNKTIYQYNTLGVIPAYFDSGINWVGLPQSTEIEQIKLLGMQFYEHGLFPTLQLV